MRRMGLTNQWTEEGQWLSLGFGDFLPVTERGARKPKVSTAGRRIQRGAVDCLFSITVGEELYFCKSRPVARYREPAEAVQVYA